MARDTLIRKEENEAQARRFRRGVGGAVATAIVLVVALSFRSPSIRESSQGPTAEAIVTAYLDFSPVVSFIGFYVAQEQSFFKDVGLQVSFEHGRGANDAATVVASGRYPLGTSSGQATIVARARGGDIVSLAVLYPNVPTVAVSHSGKPIRVPRDLLGKRIGVNEASATYNDYRWVLAERAVDRARIEEVPIGFDYTPFITGKIDVFFNYSDQMPALVSRMPSAPVEVSLLDWGLHGYGFNIVGHGAYCASNRSVCARFAQAVARGYQWAGQNPDAAAEIFSRRFQEQDPAQVRAGLNRVLAALGTGVLGAQTVAGWERTIATARESGLDIPATVTPDSVMLDGGK